MTTTLKPLAIEPNIPKLDAAFERVSERIYRAQAARVRELLDVASSGILPLEVLLEQFASACENQADRSSARATHLEAGNRP